MSPFAVFFLMLFAHALQITEKALGSQPAQILYLDNNVYFIDLESASTRI
jgi:hypothetical protein